MYRERGDVPRWSVLLLLQLTFLRESNTVKYSCLFDEVTRLIEESVALWFVWSDRLCVLWWTVWQLVYEIYCNDFKTQVKLRAASTAEMVSRQWHLCHSSFHNDCACYRDSDVKTQSEVLFFGGTFAFFLRKRSDLAGYNNSTTTQGVLAVWAVRA